MYNGELLYVYLCLYKKVMYELDLDKYIYLLKFKVTQSTQFVTAI